MPRDKEQDDKDWEAINRHRKERLERAQERVADQEAERDERRKNDKFSQEVLGLFNRVDGMTDAELERGIKNVERKTGKKISGSDRKKLKKAKGKKRRWFS